MKVIKVGASLESRIAQACDRCRSKKIRCDGIRPCCSQCAVAGFECKTSDKLSIRAFPRGYTESLEERVRALESEARELKDLLDERDEKICMLVEIATTKQMGQCSEVGDHRREKVSKLVPVEPSQLVGKHLHVFTFEVKKNEGQEELLPAAKQSKKKTKISQWIQDKYRLAKRTGASPAINLLIIDTPDDPAGEEFEVLPPRRFHEEVEVLTKPVLEVLDIPKRVLGTFGSVIFDKSSLDTAHKILAETDVAHSIIYHIALGFFSVAFRYFPESRTCVGILLVQNYKAIAADLLQDIYTHQNFIGHPLLLPLLAQRAITILVTSWLTLHKEVLIDAQAQTGYHDMVSLRTSSEFVDYSQLSTKISGTAVNIATNEFCWQVLAEHAEFMVHEIKDDPRILFGPVAKDYVATVYLQTQASRMARNAKFMLHDAESWQKKASILVQGIFNLIAQQDQNTSIGIARDSKTLAEESKQDSTSMKAIAVVTMTFLPGTFAAVCLPILNHDAHIIKNVR